ncbi:MAG: NAD(P)-binding Rossmann-like domain, partial [Bacteroidota bacterium]
MPEIQILGGGMAGLTAAYLLEQQKQPYQLHEASTHWGGKLETTLVDGFA